jgi:RNA polymerase sigma-70 factor (ECF subfamily)
MSTRQATTIDARSQAIGAADDAPLLLDEEAFRGFYERTARLLRGYLDRLTGDRQLADDLLQESYFRLLRVTTPLENDTHRRRYLFRIATNLARDARRRSLTRPAIDPASNALEIAAAPGHAPADVHRRIDLTRALDRLRPRDRAMLWLAYAQGASHHEIADVIGVGAPSVKTLLFRARRRLASLLGHDGGRS